MQNNTINSMFLNAIFNNNKKNKFYYAIVELKNGNIAKSPTYSKNILIEYLQDTQKQYNKVLKIKEDIQK